MPNITMGVSLLSRLTLDAIRCSIGGRVIYPSGDEAIKFAKGAPTSGLG